MTEPGPDPRRTLAYLADIPVDAVRGVGPAKRRSFEAASISTVADLLLTPPRRYLDRSQMSPIGSAPIGEELTISGEILEFSKRRISRRRSMVQARVSDGTGSVRVVWFNPYLTFSVGEEVALSGTIETYRGSRQMKSPDVDRLDGGGSRTTGRILPVYPSIPKVRPGDFRAAMENAVRRSVPISDVVPDDVLDTVDLVDRTFAISSIHFPSDIADVAPARKRLVFDEFLRIQMALRARAHDDYETQVGVRNSVRGPLLHRYLESLPFDLTPDQGSALDEILTDMAAGTPLHRLLQGEVGSGKTVVVIAAILTSVESGHQAAFMAPTEVLATQHYLSTTDALASASMAPVAAADAATGTASLFGSEALATRPVRVALFTSKRVLVNFIDGEVDRVRALEWLRDGTIDVAFGTHALIQPDLDFHSLGITVVDEQHRFGVEQRVALRDRDRVDGVPDLLLMTATPIPRTFVMALYGDLDVSTIRTMPSGRTPIATDAIPTGPTVEAAVDDMVRDEVARGRQVFVVCPLVARSDSIDARSAVDEHHRLSSTLEGVGIGLLHGQLASAEKAETMAAFRAGRLDVLVATTVIEVGIDVPNATLMVVWNAERFGLSQLHQLRGRVGRGTAGGRCVLVADDSTDDARRRIEAMVSTNDGFRLAEVDLEIRGHGTLFGASQSGAGDLRFGDLLRDASLVEAASDVARRAVATDRRGRFVTEILSEFAALVGSSDEWLVKS
jgi:ATP-dependent DNA helicase RecG